MVICMYMYVYVYMYIYVYMYLQMEFVFVHIAMQPKTDKKTGQLTSIPVLKLSPELLNQWGWPRKYVWIDIIYIILYHIWTLVLTPVSTCYMSLYVSLTSVCYVYSTVWSMMKWGSCQILGWCSTVKILHLWREFGAGRQLSRYRSRASTLRHVMQQIHEQNTENRIESYMYICIYICMYIYIYIYVYIYIYIHV